MTAEAMRLETMTVGVLALARPTFDVSYAEEITAQAFARLDEAGIATVGPRGLLFDAAAAREAAEGLKGRRLDALLLLQATFTDASMTLELAEAIKAPLAIWAFPEARSGGRLRLNSFCGLNLASHALGRAGVAFSYLYQSPEEPLRGGIAGWSRTGAEPGGVVMQHDVSDDDKARAATVIAGLKGRRLGLIGEHPAGFDTCRFDEDSLRELAGIGVDRIALGDLFGRASDATPSSDPSIGALKGIESVDQDQLAKSLSLFQGLASLKDEKGLSAFAVRCWPEMFTEYCCAICAPMGMMSEAGAPAACEADVYGAVTALMLQEIAGEPSWLVDIVDMDARENTSVFWHCGSAPPSMRDPDCPAEAQIHSNRRMPLLLQFPLKPGRITLARLSQANDDPHLMVAGGEVLQAPISFTGTSGVVRLDAPAERALHGLIGRGYEHHVAMVYGDHIGAVAALGHGLGLPVRLLA